jgi:Tfp pilus assembly protein PilO
MSARAVLVAVGLALVMCLAFYFLAYRPLDAQQTALETETQSLEGQAQQLRNQVASLQEIRDNELEIRADLNRLRALIPAESPAQPSFVRAAQLAADASGTTIQSLTFGLPAAVEGATPDARGLVLSEISLNAVVDGGYFQLVDFFRRLEIEVARGVQVDVVGITEAEAGFPTLSSAVTGRIFALLPLTEVAPPGGAAAPDAGDAQADAQAEVSPSASPAPAGSPAPAEDGS